MKKTLLKIAIPLFLAIVAILYFPVAPIVAILHNDVDSIEQAAIGTNWVLQRYEFTGNPREIRNWLLDYHGEAPNQQVFYSFVSWGLTHQKEVIEIVEGIEPNEKARVIGQIARGVVDSVQVNEFENAFKDFDSQDVIEIKAEIQKIKN